MATRTKKTSQPEETVEPVTPDTPEDDAPEPVLKISTLAPVCGSMSYSGSRSLRHSVRVQCGSGGRASLAFCRGACPPTAISRRARQCGSFKGLDKTANAGR